MGREEIKKMEGRSKILVDCRRRMIGFLVFGIITLGILIKLTHILYMARIFEFVLRYIGTFWALTLFWSSWVIILIILAFLVFVFWGILITGMMGAN